MTWPMHIGDKVTIKLVHNHNNDNPNKLWFLPLGVGQGASPMTS